VTAAVDANFYAYPYDLGADTSGLASYAVGALVIASVISGISAVKASWVKTLMTR
jgi:hypothetical protein